MAGLKLFSNLNPKQNKNLLTAAIIFSCLFVILLTFQFVANKAFGISGISASDIQYVQLSRINETPETWTTSDPIIIQELLDHFKKLIVVPATPSVGQYLGIRFYLKHPAGENKYLSVVLLSPTIYMGHAASANVPSPAFHILLGEKSDQEWSELLARCNKIS